MELPAALEPYRRRVIWCNYPLIWDARKHNGFGGYAKPPISPRTLRLAHTDNPETLGTYDEAAARIGQYINYNGQRVKLEGVGVSLTLSGLLAVDLDSVARLTPETPGQHGRATVEAVEIMKLFNTYAEVSPSGDGLHLLFLGTLPAEIPAKVKKGKRDIKGGTAAEYGVMSAGYVTISGDIVGNYNEIGERTAQLAEFCRKYLAEDPKEPSGEDQAHKPEEQRPARPTKQPKGRGLYTWERWQQEADGLNDHELMERIYKTPRIGQHIRALYGGDMSKYNNDHSMADLNLCGYLWGFTHDRARTERLFKESALYRDKGKSRNYMAWLLNRAERDGWQFIGTINPTPEERREYAQAKEAEEKEALRKRMEARRPSGSGNQGGSK